MTFRSLLLVVVALLACACAAAPASAARPWAPLPGEVAVPATGGAVGAGACGAVPRGSSAPAARAAQDGPSVKARVRSALGEGLITPEQAQRFEDAYDAAVRTRARLGGTRKAELASVLRQLDAFARQRTLTASRMPVLFRQLEQNTTWWAENSPPKPAKPDSRPCTGGTGQGGARVIDGETVFQWYPGNGLQTMHLASAGRANALVKACQEPNPRLPCDRARVKVAMDELVASTSERAGGRAWEAFFAFGGGRPPWVSGLWQGTAIQALARGWQVLGDPVYLETAKAGLGIFRRNAPAGVRVPTGGGGVHYLGYSFNRGLRIYNQFFQALVGLHDLGEIADDDEARALFAAGDRRAQQELAGSDTGAWSRYSANGAESDLGYHQVLRDFLRSLCDRTKAAAYCDRADRFHRYLREPAGLRFLGAAAPARVRFFLTKISCVTLKVTRDGRPVATVTRVLRRGANTLAFAPPRKGTYRVAVSARDLTNHVTTIRTTVRAR